MLAIGPRWKSSAAGGGVSVSTEEERNNREKEKQEETPKNSDPSHSATPRPQNYGSPPGVNKSIKWSDEIEKEG